MSGGTITGLLWLLGCQFVGETVARTTGVPIPGPVLGMAMLLGVLRLRDRGGRVRDGAPERAADALLRHLQLLFVPAGVGVVAYAAVLREDAVALGVALVGSWLAGLAVVGLLLQRASR